MGKLQNKVAFVTGADSGIGRAIAIAFASEGADVVVCYHSDRAGGMETAEKIRKLGRKAKVYKIDVGREAQVEKTLDKAVEDFGTLDILVNNAGVNGSNVPLHEMKTAQFDLVIKTNLYGIFFATRWLARRAAKSRGARIINISSVHEDIATAGNADYNASKGGVRMFMRTAALELAEFGITVNNIGPGMILTPMNQAAIDDAALRNEKTSHIPLDRAGKPEEIARLAVFLASSDADYVTGSTYFMDGGLMRNVGQGA